MLRVANISDTLLLKLAKGLPDFLLCVSHDAAAGPETLPDLPMKEPHRTTIRCGDILSFASFTICATLRPKRAVTVWDSNQGQGSVLTN